MDYKDNVSLQKAFSDVTNLLSNLRTRFAHTTLGLSNSNWSWQNWTVSILLVVESSTNNYNRITLTTATDPFPQRRRSWGVAGVTGPENRWEGSGYVLTALKMSRSFIQNCCSTTASFTSSRMTDLCQKRKVKTNFSRRLQAVGNRDCWVFRNHWRRV